MADATYSYTYVPADDPVCAAVVLRSDNLAVPCVLQNPDYQAFLAWMAAGNPAPEGWTGPKNE